MSDSEKDPSKPKEPQFTKKIKASIGAWWKSTVVTVEKTADEKKEGGSGQLPTKKKPAPSRKKTPQLVPETKKTEASAEKQANLPKEPVAGDRAAQPEPADTETKKTVAVEQPAEEKPKRTRQSR
ncbi:MAG: hypothetical protein V2I35_11275, partial [Desulfocapsaceae bacterium]|nr:hypothetical protein [Desulfocapsaceae bacterium]